jgi:hypothetical protein
MSNFSPKDIAEVIFYGKPSGYNANKLVLNEDDKEYTFQILLNILLEGMKIKGMVHDLSIDFEDDDIALMKLYMRSLGYDVIIDIDEIKPEDDATMSNAVVPYCCIVLVKMGNQLEYRFILNKKTIDTKKLETFEAKFSKYIIKFIRFTQSS